MNILLPVQMAGICVLALGITLSSCSPHHVKFFLSGTGLLICHNNYLNTYDADINLPPTTIYQLPLTIYHLESRIFTDLTDYTDSIVQSAYPCHSGGTYFATC